MITHECNIGVSLIMTSHNKQKHVADECVIECNVCAQDRLAFEGLSV